MRTSTLTTGRKGRGGGFTLIELLVVIAIIAILAAILFPVFARAKAKARQIACLSNFKNIATAVHMYVADNDDYMPMAYTIPYNGNAPDGQGGILRYWWPLALYPYQNDRKLWKCPEQPGDGLDILDHPDYPEYTYWAPEHVATNRYVIAPDGRNWGYPPPAGDYDDWGPVHTGMIMCPSSTFMAFDYNNVGGTYFLHSQPQLVKPENRVHMDGVNASFVDGHAKFWKFSGYEDGMFTRPDDGEYEDPSGGPFG